MAELVRYANNATSTPHGLGYAPQVYNTVGGLARGIGLLPQLARQLADWADQAASDPTVQHDQHRADLDQGTAAGQHSAETAAELLRSARQQAAMLADTLTQARAALSHLARKLDDLE